MIVLDRILLIALVLILGCYIPTWRGVHGQLLPKNFLSLCSSVIEHSLGKGATMV